MISGAAYHCPITVGAKTALPFMSKIVACMLVLTFSFSDMESDMTDVPEFWSEIF